MRTTAIRTVRVAIGALVLAAVPVAASARVLKPLDLGWERHFTLTWDTTQRHGRTVVEG